MAHCGPEKTQHPLVRASLHFPRSIPRLIETPGLLRDILSSSSFIDDTNNTCTTNKTFDAAATCPIHNKKKRPHEFISSRDTHTEQSFGSTKASTSISSRNFVQDASNLPELALSYILSALHSELLHRRNVRSILVVVERVLHHRGYHSLNDDDDDSSSFGRVNDRDFSTQNEDQHQKNGWVPCLVFMMAYDAIFSRSGGDHTAVCGNDEVWNAAIRIIRIVRCCSGSVRHCFGKHLIRLDQVTNKKKKKKVGEMQGGANKRQRTSCVDDKRVDASSSVVGTGNQEKLDDDDTPPLNNDNDDDLSPIGMKKNESSSNTTATTEIAIELSLPSPPSTPATTTPPPSTTGLSEALHNASHELQSSLLLFSNQATSSDIQSMSNQIISLITRGGSELGAEGVSAVGAILAQKSSKQQGFNDRILSVVSKSCVTEGTSALRTSAFLTSCVLPTCLGFTQDNKPASRLLVSTVCNLAKDRPKECIHGLLLPLLRTTNHDGDGGGPANGANQSRCELVVRVLKTSLPKQEIGEFLMGMVCYNNDPNTTNHNNNTTNKDIISWTDQTMPIFTTCFNTKIPLLDQVLTTTCSRIGVYSKDENMVKNVKFSALFHAFVTKYGTDMKRLNMVGTLVNTAEELKTFMKRPISMALKKLQK